MFSVKNLWIILKKCNRMYKENEVKKKKNYIQQAIWRQSGCLLADSSVET